MMAIFSFLEHVPELFGAYFYAHAHVMTQSEEPWMNLVIDSLQVIGVAICGN